MDTSAEKIGKAGVRPLIGCAATGIVHTDKDNFDIATRFRMAKDAGVFDYIEKTPAPGEAAVYMRASEETGLPLRTGGFYYTIGRDENLLLWHLVMTREVGAGLLNIQIRTAKADGARASDDEIAETYLWALENAEKVGVVPAFEVHVNMWSEHFGRIAVVADKVERRGVRFNMTLDHSHVIFKIDNPAEQKVQEMDRDIRAGTLELDPDKPGNVCARWIAANYIVHAHARAAVPANPRNIWAKQPDGTVGRGIQYPFVAPKPGEWHSPWEEERLRPWKSVLIHLLRHHYEPGSDSRLRHITTEFLPGVDYGAGAKYSIFDNNVACARWLHGLIAEREPRAD